jgi:transposase-like protein
MMGFKAFHSAQATIAGIETAHMINLMIQEFSSWP